MLTAFTWLLRIFLGLAGLAALTLVLTYYFLSRSIPDYSESFTLSGLTGEVEIVRNNANVPHIFGATDADVFFALGFAHAQDRLWQMTMLRRKVPPWGWALSMRRCRAVRRGRKTGCCR